jgi:hypothetical protein
MKRLVEVTHDVVDPIHPEGLLSEAGVGEFIETGGFVDGKR